MKILFLAPYPFDEVGSQRFRFEQYFGVMKAEKIRFSFKSFYLPVFYHILYDENKFILKSLGLISGFTRRFFHLFYSIRFDFVFIHREMAPIGPPVFEWLLVRIFRKKIIYDFDDAIWIENTSLQNSLASKLKWPKKVATICRLSYRISCGNKFLADYAKKYNPDVIILPTTIDTSFPVPVKSSNDYTTIGWTGSHSTLSYLTDLIPVIEKIINSASNIRFRIICNKKPDWLKPEFDFVYWNKHSELKDLSGIDIGIMPLPDTEWAKGKCGFKILQYFALGIPAVVSPVGLNNKIVAEGENGYFAKSTNEWYDKLLLLLNHPDTMQKMGTKAKIFLEKHYSLAANRTIFLGLFV